MSLSTRLAAAADALLGRSAYQAPPPAATAALSLDDPHVIETRERMGGQLAPQPVTQTRWYLNDLEWAEIQADTGQISHAARLMTAAKKDGVLAGVLSTRTSGLVRLPKKFRGDAEIIGDLELGHDDVRSKFDEVFPPTELALLAADGELLGVGVGEFVPVKGRDYPVFVRLSPEFLVYRWAENRWYYSSIAGQIPITPGDGRWVLHTPGGRMAPWQHGLWRAVGQAYIRKQHAQLHKDNWEAKLANPARVAYSPAGSGESQTNALFRSLMAWGINTVFSLPQGYEVKLIESNGRGYDSFNTTIANCDNEIIIAIAGQTVTVDGGAGFQNSDIHKSIRADLIKATADALAYTINTQGIPVFIALRYGVDAIMTRGVCVEWDVTPPKDRNAEATSMVTAANAISMLTAALQPYGIQIDIGAMTSRFAIPISGDVNGDGNVDDNVIAAEPATVGSPRGSLIKLAPRPLEAKPEPDADYDDDEESAAA